MKLYIINFLANKKLAFPMTKRACKGGIIMKNVIGTVIIAQQLGNFF